MKNYPFSCPGIKVRPHDNCVGVHSNILECENPDNFEPVRDEKSLEYSFSPWGFVQTGEKNNYNIPHIRELTIQNVYGKDFDCPEVQFVNHLISKKIKEMRKNNDKAEELSRCDYHLFLRMPDIMQNFPITREFIVSGGLPLRVLQDKILRSLLGFRRRVGFGYIYIDGQDASVFGPIKWTHNMFKSEFMMTSGIWKMIDDDIVRVSDILQHSGQKLDYIYDLDRWWRHTIVVSRIFERSNSTGKVQVLGGSGYFVPDDSKFFEYNQLLMLYEEGEFEEQRKMLRNQYNNSLNWQHYGSFENLEVEFNPLFFDEVVVRRNLKEALASSTTPPNIALDPPEFDSEFFIDNFIAFVHLNNPDKLNRSCCWTCGNPNNLRKGERSLYSHYCSSDCEEMAINDVSYLIETQSISDKRNGSRSENVPVEDEVGKTNHYDKFLQSIDIPDSDSTADTSTIKKNV